MSASRARFLSSLALVLGLPSVFLGLTGHGASADADITTPDAEIASADAEIVQAPADYGNGCVLYPDNKAATIDSLKFRCAPEQQDAIFRDAPLGSVPTGVKDGWVTRPPIMQAIAPGLWIGKIFYTGQEGGFLMNRVTAAGIEAWQADVRVAPARVDGRPTWALDYTPSPTPPVYDEIREITPGVWFGYSWWRGMFQTTLLLTFALA